MQLICLDLQQRHTATDSFKILTSHYVLPSATLLPALLCVWLSLLQEHTRTQRKHYNTVHNK